MHTVLRWGEGPGGRVTTFQGSEGGRWKNGGPRRARVTRQCRKRAGGKKYTEVEHYKKMKEGWTVDKVKNDNGLSFCEREDKLNKGNRETWQHERETKKKKNTAGESHKRGVIAREGDLRGKEKSLSGVKGCESRTMIRSGKLWKPHAELVGVVGRVVKRRERK